MQQAFNQGHRKGHLEGRQREAADAHAGAGYTFDLSEIPKLEPATPEKLLGTPERKRGPALGTVRLAKSLASPDPSVPKIKYRPNPDHKYDLGTIRSQLSKVHGSRKTWLEPVFEAAGVLPVGGKYIA